ncbi:DJ-1/PfpI family protein [Coprinopsis sp. MPI-PUGE-AT-0042]|nr:DJ-1/PfpI family protein [Coprinopsis sp. MPI-PUGE-AT-0042]
MKFFAALLALPLLVTAQIPNPPTSFGVLMFPLFTALDVYGPLDIITRVAYRKNLTLSMIARTMDPVTTNQTFGTTTMITHTLSAPPPDLEERGTRHLDLQPEIDFIRNIFPSLRYVISVCTGSVLIAKAGIIDGKMATGNKQGWGWLTAQSNKVHWIGKARWVVSSDKIWTTSGVSAGVDGTLAWVSEIYGEELATLIGNGAEWNREIDPSQDRFAEIWGAKDVLPTE